MFKTIKFLAISAIALLTACCNPDNGNEGGNDKVPQQGFHVSLSADTIYANGTDVAQFSAYYNGVALTAEEVMVYDVVDGVKSEEVSTSIQNLQLCTTIPGEYNYVLTYTADEEEHTSEVFTINVIAEANVEAIPGEKGMTVRATTSLLSVGESVTFVARYDGEVLSSLNGVTLVDTTTGKTLTTGTKVVNAADGTPYTLLTYTPTKAGSYSVAVNGGPLYGNSYAVSFKVVDYEIPSRPADSKPASTSFKRRSLIMQFTGLNCGNCPPVRSAMESVFAEEQYKETAVHTAIHCATYSPDRSFVIYHNNNLDLSTALGVTSWPTYWVDWVHQNGNQGITTNIKNIKKYLDQQQASPAKAGIAARMMWKRNTLVVRVSVKAATDGDFYVGAWLLENGLKGTQAGSTNPEHMIHNNVVRIADSHPEGGSNWSYYGHPLGTLSKGDVTDYLFEMELKDGWAASNCHLAIFVSYYDSKSKSVEVTNAVETKSLTSGVSFQYVE